MRCFSRILPIAGMSCAAGPVSPAGPTRNGVVLIVVLVLVVMMSLAGFGFMNRMATEYEATLINADSRQASANSGERRDRFTIYHCRRICRSGRTIQSVSPTIRSCFPSRTVREATGDFAEHTAVVCVGDSGVGDFLS